MSLLYTSGGKKKSLPILPNGKLDHQSIFFGNLLDCTQDSVRGLFFLQYTRKPTRINKQRTQLSIAKYTCQNSKLELELSL